MAASILVVDDDRSILDLLGLHLRNAGYEVQVAEDAIVAGHMVLNKLPDLIICDVKMPYMDDFEFVAALKGDDSIPDVPVLFLSSVDDGERRGRELGAVGYFVKPVRVDRLLATIARHVPGGAIPIG